jgi:hypothetical protein
MNPEDTQDVNESEKPMTLEQMQAQLVPLTSEQEMDVAHLEANEINAGISPEVAKMAVDTRRYVDGTRNWSKKLGEEEAKARKIYAHDKQFHGKDRGEGPFIPTSNPVSASDTQSQPNNK